MLDPLQISELLRATAAELGVRPATASVRASGSGDTIARLESGCDITLRRASRIVQWCSDHWPPGRPWPSAIPRPAPDPDSPGAGPTPRDLALRALVNAATGEIDDHAALLDAIGLPPSAMATVKYVLAYYADGRERSRAAPRSSSLDCRDILRAFVAAGDRRFAARAARLRHVRRRGAA